MMGKAGDFPNIPISHVLGCGCGVGCIFWKISSSKGLEASGEKARGVF
jgi:hypothetical protein